MNLHSQLSNGVTLCCPVCGRGVPVYQNGNSSPTAFQRIRRSFYHSGVCPNCAITFKVTKFEALLSHYLGNTLPFQSAPDSDTCMPAKIPRSQEYTPRLALPRRSASPLPTTVTVEQEKPPFILELNNMSLGIHFSIKLSGVPLGQTLKMAAQYVVNGTVWCAEQLAILSVRIPARWRELQEIQKLEETARMNSQSADLIAKIESATLQSERTELEPDPASVPDETLH